LRINNVGIKLLFSINIENLDSAGNIIKAKYFTALLGDKPGGSVGVHGAYYLMAIALEMNDVLS